MKLQEGQLEQFERDGYIIIPELFSQKDVSILKAEVPKVFAQKREENVREKDGQTVRTSFATHTYNKLTHVKEKIGCCSSLMSRK